MAQVPLRSSWMASRWGYVAWAAFIATAIGLSLWTDWGTDLGRASQGLWIGMEGWVEEVIASMGAGLEWAMGRFTDWIGAWGRWMNHGRQAAGHVGEHTWFLPVALISLIGLALYQLLEGLYEDRSPSHLRWPRMST